MENVLKTTKADEKALLEAESRYCSYGDTVHYLEPAKLFAGCNGSFLYDYEDKPYLDLQMWYSAVNFGYANPRLNDALKRQIDTLPQVASQYLHKEKIELAAMLCESIKDAWGEEGRVHFNVGGSQAIEDSLKLVRNACGGKSLDLLVFQISLMRRQFVSVGMDCDKRLFAYFCNIPKSAPAKVRHINRNAKFLHILHRLFAEIRKPLCHNGRVF